MIAIHSKHSCTLLTISFLSIKHRSFLSALRCVNSMNFLIFVFVFVMVVAFILLLDWFCKKDCWILNGLLIWHLLLNQAARVLRQREINRERNEQAPLVRSPRVRSSYRKGWYWFSIQYVPRKEVKGKALADLMDHPSIDIPPSYQDRLDVEVEALSTSLLLLNLRPGPVQPELQTHFCRRHNHMNLRIRLTQQDLQQRIPHYTMLCPPLLLLQRIKILIRKICVSPYLLYGCETYFSYRAFPSI